MVCNAEARMQEGVIVHREFKNPHPHPPLQVWRGGF